MILLTTAKPEIEITLITTVPNRLAAARSRRFVGRSTEQSLFQSALSAPEFPFVVLYVHGPGGVGKTSLLKQFSALAEQAEAVVLYLDARTFDPSPESFNQALRAAIQAKGAAMPSEATPTQMMAASPQRHVLLLDTYELLAPLDAWLRDVFLPQTSENVLVVMAGRQAPAAGWRADSVWSELMRVVPLRNLTPDETRAYLTVRGIPQDQLQGMADFTHGHPLALSLIADTFAQRQNQTDKFRPEDAPDVIKTLLEQFVQKVPGPAHRAALEACALARVMTEGLLSIVLDMPLVDELFDWLRGLSFIESNRLGLFPHDLLREALVADLRWRNPDWYAELHKRARNYYKRRLQETTGADQQRVLADYLFLHRDNMMMRPFFDWQESGATLPEPMRPNDLPALLEMVTHHEGTESATLARHWLSKCPHGVTVLVYRETGHPAPAGFLCWVELNEVSDEDRAADPATRNAWSYLQRHAPLRAGERATHFRFWMTREGYQNVGAIQTVMSINISQHELLTPRLAYSFLPVADPEFWELAAAYTDRSLIETASFAVGGKSYGAYGHDWRVTPPMALLELLAEREIAIMSLETLAPKPQISMVALSEDEFATAVKNTLRDLARIEALRSSPLLRSRLVMEPQSAAASSAANDKARAEALRGLVVKTIEALQASPREAKLYRALLYTYVKPAPTQEQAAEMLDLPFSTYRRHLQSGIARVTEILWQRELGG